MLDIMIYLKYFYKDNKEYIVSPNNVTFHLDLFSLYDNKKILSIQGHKNNIRTIRYFINMNNYNEYLISADDHKIVIVWDITNNYSIKNKIDTHYKYNIYSCLLAFPYNISENYIITSTTNISVEIDSSATKIYSMNDGKFVKYINRSNNYIIFYLLFWHNKKNNKYYIIQFANERLIINSLLTDELYSHLVNKPEGQHFCGFIYSKENKDYLCSSSNNGFIKIWDLYDKKIFKVFNTNDCLLMYIIQWNEKYIIVADKNNKSFKIIDIESNKIITEVKAFNMSYVKSVKKINHPIYGESLFVADGKGTIKLWSI